MAEKAEKKTEAQKLKEQLCYAPKNAGERLSDEEWEKADLFCEGYKKFLDLAKTEREAVEITISMAREKGFKAFDPKVKYEAGDRVFLNNRGKAIILCTVGTEPLEKGVRIVAAHIDSPRIDLKPRPLYEEAQLAMFKTHYYGGIKKYQWTAIPLALHGVVIRADGERVAVTVGEDEGDPVFTITDLLPHLAGEQMQRKLSDGIKGESLNVLVGGRMFRDDKESERVKLGILKLLNEKYGIVEADFLSAELTMVPAYHAVDVGLDRSFIGAYGHDDRVCAYTALTAALKNDRPAYTSVTVLADKEEIGSTGNSGLNSRFLEYSLRILPRLIIWRGARSFRPLPAFRQTSTPPLTPPTVRCMRKTTPPIATTALWSPNIPGPEESRAPAMLRLNSWGLSAGFSMTPGFSGRRANSGRLTRAAAVPLPCSLPL